MSVVQAIREKRFVSANRREFRHVIWTLLFGLALRLAIFKDVAVNGDTGLYIYDAKQLLWGRRILVDFPSRSPLMEYLLAGVIWLGESPIISVRMFMVLVSVVLGTCIYLFARELHSHEAGVAALVLFMVTPFSLVWGVWVKTEPVSGAVLLATFLVALRYLDGETIPLKVSVAIGILFGAAFFLRRVAIVHIGAFALFVLLYRYHQHGDIRGSVTAAVAVLSTAIGSLLVGYWLLAGFDVSLAGRIANQHAIALFGSGGQGGIGWVGIERASAVTAAESTGILDALCQKCGANTIDIFTRTILVTLPVLMLLLVMLRSYTRGGSEFMAEVALPVGFTIAALAQITLLVGVEYYDRILGVVVWLLAVGLIWRTEAVEWDDFWNPKLGLPIAVLLGLTAGYLYRDRILYTTYFQDFYPYVVTLAGICYVEFRRANQRHWETVRVALFILLVVGSGVAMANAYPYQPDGVEQDSHWFTVEMVQEYGDDIDARTEPGDKVFTAQPLYVVESDRQIAGHLARKYYAFRGWPESEAVDHTRGQLISDMDSGDVTVAITDSESQWVLEDDRLRGTFTDTYCEQNTDLYRETGATLHVLESDNPTDTCDRYEHDSPRA